MCSGETSVASVTKLLNLDQSMDQHNKIDQHKNNDQHNRSECHLIKCSVRIRLSIPCICLFPFSLDKPRSPPVIQILLLQNFFSTLPSPWLAAS